MCAESADTKVDYCYPYTSLIRLCECYSVSVSDSLYTLCVLLLTTVLCSLPCLIHIYLAVSGNQRTGLTFKH